MRSSQSPRFPHREGELGRKLECCLSVLVLGCVIFVGSFLPFEASLHTRLQLPVPRSFVSPSPHMLPTETCCPIRGIRSWLVELVEHFPCAMHCRLRWKDCAENHRCGGFLSRDPPSSAQFRCSNVVFVVPFVRYPSDDAAFRAHLVWTLDRELESAESAHSRARLPAFFSARGFLLCGLLL